MILYDPWQLIMKGKQIAPFALTIKSGVYKRTDNKVNHSKKCYSWNSAHMCDTLDCQIENIAEPPFQILVAITLSSKFFVKVTEWCA